MLYSWQTHWPNTNKAKPVAVSLYHTCRLSEFCLLASHLKRDDFFPTRPLQASKWNYRLHKYWEDGGKKLQKLLRARALLPLWFQTWETEVGWWLSSAWICSNGLAPIWSEGWEALWVWAPGAVSPLATQWFRRAGGKERRIHTALRARSPWPGPRSAHCLPHSITARKWVALRMPGRSFSGSWVFGTQLILKHLHEGQAESIYFLGY